MTLQIEADKRTCSCKDFFEKVAVQPSVNMIKSTGLKDIDRARQEMHLHEEKKSDCFGV